MTTLLSLPLTDPAGGGEGIFAESLPHADLAVLFPSDKSHRENKVMGLTPDGEPFMLNPLDPADVPGAVYLPYYLYAADGQRQHNVTDWAVEQYRQAYSDVTICQSDIFYYTYAMLHHPQVHGQGGIPVGAAFWQISDAGRSLTALHLTPGDAEKVREETAQIAASLPT